MKKILVVGMSDNIGGIETCFHNYYRCIDPKRYHFDFVTVCSSIAFADEYIKNGSVIYDVPNFLKHPLKYYRKMRKIIAKNKYDVVHINMFSAANVLPVKAALIEGVPNIIVHSHSTDTPSGFLRKVLHEKNKKILSDSRLTRVACCTESADWFFDDTSDYYILNNAIDLERFKFDSCKRELVRKKYGIKEDEYLIGNVGHLSEDKNQSFLLDVLTLINNKKIKLMIIGDGKLRNALEIKLKLLCLENRAIVIPNNPNIEDFYSAFDLFVFPSIFEGMPLAPVEAQANGLECILSSALESRKVLSEQLFLSVDATRAWADLIEKKAKDDIGKREHFEKHIRNCGFDIATEYRKLMEIYDNGGLGGKDE